MVVRLGLLLVWLMLGTVAAAGAERRFALVIGNNSYVHLDAGHQLQKAVNDANTVGDALERDGFQVLRGINLNRSAMVDKLFELTSQLQPGDTAFFYFAGHGVALGTGNYLLPSDVPEASSGPGQDSRIASQSLAESDIVASLQERGTRVAIIVLDACRDNPFKRPGVRSVGLERGFGRMPEANGVFSLYSAGFGQSALDRLSDDDHDPNSVFTRVLAPLLTKPGLNLDDLAFDVREKVAKLAATSADHHEQVPAAYNQIVGGRIYLGGPPADMPQPAPAADEIAWSFVQISTDPAQVEAFINRFPNSPLRAKAEARLSELNAARTLAADPKAPTANDAKPPDAAGSRPTKPIVTAKLEPPPADLPNPVSADPGVIAVAVQTELRRVGCQQGPILGGWTAQARKALLQFSQHQRLTLDIDHPNEETLKILQSREGTVCSPTKQAIPRNLPVPKRATLEPPVIIRRPPPPRYVAPPPPRQVDRRPVYRPPVHHAPTPHAGGGGSSCFMFNGERVCE